MGDLFTNQIAKQYILSGGMTTHVGEEGIQVVKVGKLNLICRSMEQNGDLVILSYQSS